MQQSTHEPDLGQLRLGFFDVEAILRSDSETYLRLFEQMYRHFQLESDLAFGHTPIEYTVLTTANNPWGKPVVLIDGQAQALSQTTLLEAFVYETILHSIISRVQSHFLIHAGVVSYETKVLSSRRIQDTGKPR